MLSSPPARVAALYAGLFIVAVVVFELEPPPLIAAIVVVVALIFAGGMLSYSSAAGRRARASWLLNAGLCSQAMRVLGSRGESDEELPHEHLPILRRAATCYEERGEYFKAIAAAKMVLHAEPSDLTVLEGLARLYERVGLHDDAKEVRDSIREEQAGPGSDGAAQQGVEADEA